MTIEQRIQELTLSHLTRLHQVQFQSAQEELDNDRKVRALRLQEQEYRTEQARLQLEATRLVIKEQRKEGPMA